MENNAVSINLIEELFQLFYYKVLNKQHLIGYFSDQTSIAVLIKKQSELLKLILSATTKEDEKKIKDIFKRVIETHIKINLYLKDFVEFLDFIKENTLNLIESGALWQDKEKLEDLFQEFKDMSYKLYIKDKLRKMIESSQAISKVLNHRYFSAHIQFLEKMEDIILNNKNYTLPKETECKVGTYFKTAMFLIESYAAKEYRVGIQKVHSDFHRNSENFLLYYRNKEFEKAYDELNKIEISLSMFLAITLIITYKWEKEKDVVISKLVLDPLFSKNIVGYLFVPVKYSRYEGEPYDNIDEELEKVFLSFSESFVSEVNSYMSPNIAAFLHRDDNNSIYRTFIFDIKGEERELREIFDSAYSKALEKVKKENVISDENIDNYITLVKINPYELKKKVDYDYSLFNLLLNEIPKEKDLTEEKILNIIKNIKKISEIIEYIRGNKKEQVELNIYAQPLINLESKEILGIEILSRMFLDGELIPAYQFIDTIKFYNYQNLFDILVLTKLKDFIEKCSFKVKRIFVNLFPSSYINEKVVKLLSELSNLANKKGITLVFEVIEQEDYNIANLIERVKNMPVELALDDFGAGYSNLYMFGELSKQGKLKFLKVDGSIIKNIKDESFRKILRSIIFLGLSLDKSLIFEFVEDEETENILKEEIKRLQSNFASKDKEETVFVQGFFYSKPRALEDFIN